MFLSYENNAYLIEEHIQLVKESITVWEEIANMPDKDLKEYEHECPLCENLGHCEVCPIAEDTGETACYSTPFYNTRVYKMSDYYGTDVLSATESTPTVKDDECMIEYLQGLLGRLKDIRIFLSLRCEQDNKLLTNEELRSHLCH